MDDVNLTTIDDLEDVKFTRKTTVKIMISQCKKENSFKELTIDRLLTTLPELFNLEKSEDALLVRFNSDLIDKSLLAREVWKKCL